MMTPPMAIDKEKLKKGIVLVVALAAMGIALQFMGGNQSRQYFMIELPDGSQVFAQVADSPEKHLEGLFFTEELRPNQGMLFIYQEEDPHKLWTRNVHFPIDMVWIDRDRTILHLVENAPPCSEEPCEIYGPEEPFTLYVLQARAGFIRNHNLKKDESLVFRLYQGGQ